MTIVIKKLRIWIVPSPRKFLKFFELITGCNYIFGVFGTHCKKYFYVFKIHYNYMSIFSHSLTLASARWDLVIYWVVKLGHSFSPLTNSEFIESQVLNALRLYAWKELKKLREKKKIELIVFSNFFHSLFYAYVIWTFIFTNNLDIFSNLIIKDGFRGYFI